MRLPNASLLLAENEIGLEGHSQVFTLFHPRWVYLETLDPLISQGVCPIKQIQFAAGDLQW